ncbi:MAG: GerMN domain-containing protein [Ilumatobacteraceae bacterium]
MRPRPGARPARLVASAICSFAVLTACGISTDQSPRDINAPARPNNSSDIGKTGITATSTSVIYLVGHDDTGRFVLKPTARDVTETIDNALQALFAGPTTRELNADLRSAIPASTRLVSALPNNDVVTVDVTASIAELTGSTLVDAIGQIVLTAANVTGVSGVVITIDSVTHPWPTPNGGFTTDPLTRADFVALLPNSGVRATDPTVAPTGVPTTAPTSETTAVRPASPPTTATPAATPPPTAAVEPAVVVEAPPGT